MPCNHKFKHDLTLSNLDFLPNTLIIGTFNPAWPESNIAEWFYGRITGGINDHDSGNHLWAVLPRIYGKSSLKELGGSHKWKKFCRDHGIAITDLISCISDAQDSPEHRKYLKDYSDKTIVTKFKLFEFTNIIDLLNRNPTIKNVYLTRGDGDTFWKKLWKPIKVYCDANHKRCTTLMTPSDYAFYQQGTYNRLNPDHPLNREDFILKCWSEKWHSIL